MPKAAANHAVPPLGSLGDWTFILRTQPRAGGLRVTFTSKQSLGYLSLVLSHLEYTGAPTRKPWLMATPLGETEHVLNRE